VAELVGGNQQQRFRQRHQQRRSQPQRPGLQLPKADPASGQQSKQHQHASPGWRDRPGVQINHRSMEIPDQGAQRNRIRHQEQDRRSRERLSHRMECRPPQCRVRQSWGTAA